MKKLKQFFFDVIGLAGIASFTYGVYLQFGNAIAHMSFGVILVIFAIKASISKRG